jgi:hypothetical protein
VHLVRPGVGDLPVIRAMAALRSEVRAKSSSCCSSAAPTRTSRAAIAARCPQLAADLDSWALPQMSLETLDVCRQNGPHSSSRSLLVCRQRDAAARHLGNPQLRCQRLFGTT